MWFLICGLNIVPYLLFLNGNVYMELLDTRKFPFPVKVVKWPPLHINDVVLNMCKKTIILFIMKYQFLVPCYIYDDVIKHKTTLHDTYRIIITDILMFQWIHNRESCQGNIFWWKSEFIAKWWKFLYLIIFYWMKTTFQLK